MTAHIQSIELIYQDYEPSLAPQLAEMWNASDPAWPWGFTGDIKLTPDLAAEMIERRRTLRNIVAMDSASGRMVGFCQLTEHPKLEQGACYVSLLNVRPSHHGLSIGRRLLVRAVEEAISREFRRVDLNTWPANFKALPLYKRCGFFWVPGTNVAMQNYIPLLFQNTIARPFLEEHGWYRSLVTGAEPFPDFARKGAREAYAYLFRDGKDELRIVLDAAAGTLLEISSPQLRVWLEAGPKDARVGEKRAVACHLANLTASPAAYNLGLSAAGNVAARLRSDHPSTTASVIVPPGKTVSRSFELSFGDSAGDAAGGSWVASPESRVEVRVVAASTEKTTSTEKAPSAAPLAAGFTVFPPLRVELDAPRPYPVPGREFSLNVLVSAPPGSDLTGKSGRLVLTAEEGLVLEPRETAFTLEPGPKGASAVVSVRAAATRGSHRLTLRAEAAEAVASHGEAIAAPAPGDDIAYREGEHACLASFDLAATVSAVGGAFSLVERESGGRLLSVGPEMPGARRWPSSLANTRFALETGENPASVAAEAVLPDNHSLVLRRLVRMHGGSHLEIAYFLANTGSEGADLPLTTSVAFAETWLEAADIVLPGARPADACNPDGAVVREPFRAGAFPFWGRDLPRDNARWPQRWLAFERDGWALGLVWPEQNVREVSVGSGEVSFLLQPGGPLKPGETLRFAPIHLFAGPGSWKAVHGLWRRLFGPTSQQGARVPEPGPVLDVTVRPGVFVVPTPPDAEAEVEVEAVNRRLWPKSGTIEIIPPEGLRADPGAIPVAGLTAETPLRTAIRLVPTADDALASAGFPVRVGTALLNTSDRETRAARFGILYPSGGAPDIRADEGHGAWSVDSGKLRLAGTTSYSPGLLELKAYAPDAREDENRLASPYPSDVGFGWLRPWYGGVYPFVADSDSWLPGINLLGLYGESSRPVAEALAEQGQAGWTWRGVRVAGEVVGPRYHALAWSLGFLTLPGLPLAVCRLTVRNRGTRTAALTTGVAVCPARNGALRYAHAQGMPAWNAPPPETPGQAEGFAAQTVAEMAPETVPRVAEFGLRSPWVHFPADDVVYAHASGTNFVEQWRAYGTMLCDLHRFALKGGEERCIVSVVGVGGHQLGEHFAALARLAEEEGRLP